MKKFFIALLALITFNLSQAQTAPAQVKPAKAHTTKPAAKAVEKKAEKKTVTETKTAAPVAAHLKKDGTPDKRYKESQHLKKDGTPDKRYKENKK
ncbi:hypothetical protein [Niabella hirudinis]|uniref:hypothetical protein n=1 Tax=Niabella hirudinis TaxID=1285929 RepID=UPI003EBB25D8